MIPIKIDSLKPERENERKLAWYIKLKQKKKNSPRTVKTFIPDVVSFPEEKSQTNISNPIKRTRQNTQPKSKNTKQTPWEEGIKHL